MWGADGLCMIMIAINYIGSSFNTVCPHILKYEWPRTVNYVRCLANHV